MKYLVFIIIVNNFSIEKKFYIIEKIEKFTCI